MQIGNVSAEDAYLYWNMGNGMLLVADEDQVSSIIEKADKLSYQVQVAGEVIKEKMITIQHQNISLSEPLMV